MFWSGNYIAVRQLNFLLKEENVSLTQVLEADDILQECKADNKALIQFLTKPEVLAELITLITEEPPKNVELSTQYRHASIACEVLTSHLSMLSDRLSHDTVQMNRLCDFINQEPPLNPLLASYFSKTVEMLLERSPKQDWYLYHIVCLRVLDFFKSRRDFLPNLLRHLATSAIADTFKYFIRLDDLFNKTVMEWLEEHQFLESLIQIICGTYVPEPLRPATAAAAAAHTDAAEQAESEHTEKAERELSEKPELNHKEDGDAREEEKPNTRECSSGGGAAGAEACRRARAVAAANAAGLLCDLILNGCAGEGCTTRLRTVWVLVSRLQSEEWVRALLGGMFTSPREARAAAIVHGCQVLLALLSTDPILGGQCAAERTSVELAVAPHLPLLHQALLQEPDAAAATQEPAPGDTNHQEAGGGGGGGGARVGLARVQVCALLAHLALSEVEDVPQTIITLGTPGTLVELFFSHPDNNFLHAQVYALIKHALNNRAYRTQYANHLLIECDLLTRLMDVFEENEDKKAGRARAGYMGHVVLALRRVWRALDEQDGELRHALRLPAPLLQRFDDFLEHRLRPLLHQHDTPLGGYYPSENIYEVENMADSMEASYEYNDNMVGGGLDDIGEDINIDAVGELNMEGGEGGEGGADEEKMAGAKSSFLELASQRFDDDMWEDSPEMDEELASGASAHDIDDVLAAVSPWESGGAGAGAGGGGESAGGEGWAQFNLAPPAPPADPFAPHGAGATRDHLDAQDFNAFWPCSDVGSEPDATTRDLDIEQSMRNLHLEESLGNSSLPDGSASLANNLLTAMSGMAPDLIANIVNANMDAPPHPCHAPDPTSTPTGPDSATADPASTPAASDPTPADPAPAPSDPDPTPADPADTADS